MLILRSCLALSIAASAAVAQNSCYNFSSVNGIIDAYLATRPSTPGFAVQIKVDGQVVYQRTRGLVTPQTPMPIASATKALSGAVLASLLQDGTISLDDRVSTYIPEFRTPDLLGITVRQAYAMTSGLTTDNDCIAIASSTLAQCAAEIAAAGLRTGIEPGEEFYYGDDGQHVIGRVCEVASATPFVELFQQRIAAPLGMTDTLYNSQTNPRIAGGATSTLNDYMKFVEMLLRQGRAPGQPGEAPVQVLSPLSVEAMQNDQTQGARIGYTPPTIPPDTRYGLGLWRLNVPDQPLGTHFIDPGLYGFHPWYDTARDISGVFAVFDVNSLIAPLVFDIQAEARRIVDRKLDFNADGVYPDVQDIADFVFVFSGGTCDACGSIDFNNDGVFPDTSDYFDYLRFFAGGPCF